MEYNLVALNDGTALFLDSRPLRPVDLILQCADDLKSEHIFYKYVQSRQ